MGDEDDDDDDYSNGKKLIQILTSSKSPFSVFQITWFGVWALDRFPETFVALPVWDFWLYY
jgi:hypothetical protein